MKFKLSFISIILVLALLSCSAQGMEISQNVNNNTVGNQSNTKAKDIYERSEFVLGTIVSIRLFEDGSETILDQVFNRMVEIENKMSFNSSISEVIKVNEAAGVKAVSVSKDTFQVVEASLEFASKSDGKFDLTIGPLVKLWGIGSENASVPSESDRLRSVKLTNWNDVELNKINHSIHLKNIGMEIDLGAIAKGYASDEVVRILNENNISRAIINLGGNVYALGEKEDESPWKIGIQNPFSTRGEYIGIVSLTNKSVVTSGIYERYFEQGGVQYHHILDTTTGFPITNELVSVTVISQSSINADALSTILFALGVEDGIKFLEKNYPEVDAVFITQDKNVYVKGLENNIEWTDNEFRVY